MQASGNGRFCFTRAEQEGDILELFKLLGTIAIDNARANDALEDTSGRGERFGQKLDQVFSKIGSAAVKVGKVVATGLTAGAAAMSGLTIKALDLAGELEQNLGGSEAVFAEYAGKMQAVASEAYKNMGLSQADFLATANKMGALFKGAGFEIADAADITAEAMQRAADVASIMGIDVSSAMESIAGAAKGNFTMMDNLGVAMNDTTLQAYALEKGIEKSTMAMTTQEKVALAMKMFLEKTAYAAGNYAKENATLSGSLTTAKAALKDFLSGAADSEALVDALIGASDVISDKVLDILPSLVSGINNLFNKLIPKLPPIIQKVLPTIISGAVELMRGLVNAADAIVDVMIDIVPDLIDGFIKIVELVGEKLPDIIAKLIPAVVEGGLKLISSLAKSLVNAIPDFLDALGRAFSGVLDVIHDFLGICGEAGESAYKLAEAHRETVRAVEESVEASAELKREYEKNAQSVIDETERTKSLWGELQTLTNKNGEVKSGYEDRARYILGELNEALGTEYTMNGNIIGQYQTMQSEIDALIEKRRAERLLKTYEDSYFDAKEKESDAEGRRYQLEKDEYYAREAYNQALADAAAYQNSEEYRSGVGSQMKMDDLLVAVDDAQQKLREVRADLQIAEQDLNNARATTTAYEMAEQEILVGHYANATELLTEDLALKWEALRQGKEINEQDRQSLKESLARKESDLIYFYKNMLAGEDGYTEERYKTKAREFEQYKKLYESATGDAYKLSQNCAEALAAGLDDNNGLLQRAGHKIMDTALRAMKEAAQIASPSKVARGYGRNVTGSLAIGLEDEAETAENAASGVMKKTLDVFNDAKYHHNLYGADLHTAYSPTAEQSKPVEYAENRDSYTQSSDLARAVSDAISRTLPDILTDALSSMRFDINNREFARLVKAVN